MIYLIFFRILLKQNNTPKKPIVRLLIFLAMEIALILLPIKNKRKK